MKPELDFIVIGAIKAATTWLQAQLHHHPDLIIPEIEPHFFTREHERGWDWYRSLFPRTKEPGTLWGEKTADYLAKTEAAERIRTAYPDAKLVVQLRNPIDRAYSDYKMLLRRGTISGPPEDYLRSMDNPQPRFLHDGLYAQHLRRWLNLFPRESILIFTFDDVRSQPQQTLEAVYNHIGARKQIDSEVLSRKFNDSGEKHLPLRVRKLLKPLKPIVRPFRNSAIFQRTHAQLAAEIKYPPLADETRKSLANFYFQDIEDLSKMLGRDLTYWIRPDLEGKIAGSLNNHSTPSALSA
ncbi:sulfotransferase family protein [Erythrobacter sp. R86502]|uniref:sulfotransferase family protein n=1 Tax=Erythrobacter sp. R86502 TaxID=3093846 RepID=UPI0036D26C2A